MLAMLMYPFINPRVSVEETNVPEFFSDELLPEQSFLTEECVHGVHVGRTKQ